jgi:hypothetical protein
MMTRTLDYRNNSGRKNLARGKFYRGVIKQVHVDGTFDILYDDGDFESKVNVKYRLVKEKVLRSILTTQATA